jgi:hypothetical protein
MTRLRGRAPRGERCHASAPCGHWTTSPRTKASRRSPSSPPSAQPSPKSPQRTHSAGLSLAATAVVETLLLLECTTLSPVGGGTAAGRGNRGWNRDGVARRMAARRADPPSPIGKTASAALPSPAPSAHSSSTAKTPSSPASKSAGSRAAPIRPANSPTRPTLKEQNGIASAIDRQSHRQFCRCACRQR